MNKLYLTLLSLVLCFSVAFTVSASEPVSKSFFGGVAIGDRDTVRYGEIFAATGNRKIENPLPSEKGKSKYMVVWKGASWYFTSQRTKDLFEANPEKYAPVFNGYCANALSIGEGLVGTDGEHWEIFGDNLFQFYSEGGRKRWATGDWKKYEVEARKAWAELTAGK